MAHVQTFMRKCGVCAGGSQIVFLRLVDNNKKHSSAICFMYNFDVQRIVSKV